MFASNFNNAFPASALSLPPGLLQPQFAALLQASPFLPGLGNSAASLLGNTTSPGLASVLAGIMGGTQPGLFPGAAPMLAFPFFANASSLPLPAPGAADQLWSKLETIGGMKGYVSEFALGYLFREMDADGNGSVNPTELTNFKARNPGFTGYSNIPGDISPNIFQQPYNAADTNRDRLWNRDEFNASMGGTRPALLPLPSLPGIAPAPTDAAPAPPAQSGSSIPPEVQAIMDKLNPNKAPATSAPQNGLPTQGAPPKLPTLPTLPQSGSPATGAQQQQQQQQGVSSQQGAPSQPMPGGMPPLSGTTPASQGKPPAPQPSSSQPPAPGKPAGPAPQTAPSDEKSGATPPPKNPATAPASGKPPADTSKGDVEISSQKEKDAQKPASQQNAGNESKPAPAPSLSEKFKQANIADGKEDDFMVDILAFDRNRSHFFNINEFEELMSALGLKIPFQALMSKKEYGLIEEAAMLSLIASFDENKDKKLNREEFDNFIRAQEKLLAGKGEAVPADSKSKATARDAKDGAANDEAATDAGANASQDAEAAKQAEDDASQKADDVKAAEAAAAAPARAVGKPSYFELNKDRWYGVTPEELMEFLSQYAKNGVLSPQALKEMILNLQWEQSRMAQGFLPALLKAEGDVKLEQVVELIFKTLNRRSDNTIKEGLVRDELGDLIGDAARKKR